MSPIPPRVLRAADRYAGGDPATGVDTRHAFSFGPFYDPDNVRWGQLTACNEERLAPGAGFPPHRHRDVEIVSWVIEGELTHEDADGTRTVIRPGDLQRLTAGSGVQHSERNEGRRPLRFAQMWLVADRPGGPPDYEVVRGFAPDTPYTLPRTEGTLRLLRGDAALAAGDGELLHLRLTRGSGALDGERLYEGDSVRLAAGAFALRAGEEGLEALLWSLAEPADRRP
ncbi:pirin family protein [Streptomyces sedi]|uniref:Pirin family protein n=1 Tax=Streptomyces sedi TaxID=555059 RepID=A0A5C4VCE1_9ACTN|nr:pirin family protein [Streptomyces sedi]TNM33452.1 pirin family protein [Streptomyces sedi]